MKEAAKRILEAALIAAASALATWGVEELKTRVVEVREKKKPDTTPRQQ